MTGPTDRVDLARLSHGQVEVGLRTWADGILGEEAAVELLIAAAIGLTVDPCNEQLYRDAVTAAGTRGDTDEIHRPANNILAHLHQIDTLEEEETETYERIRGLVGTGNDIVGYRRTEPAGTRSSGNG